MATATLRDIEHGNASADLTGKRRRTLVYQVDADAVFLGNTGNIQSVIGLPQKGQLDPIDPTFGLVDSHEIISIDENPGYSHVRVNVSNDRSFRLHPRPDRTNPLYKANEDTDEDEVSEIPHLRTWPIAVPNSATPEQGFDYEIFKARFDGTYEVRLRSVFWNVWGTTERAIVRSQKKKLHNINGEALLFLGARATHTDTLGYEVEYRWRSDPGVLKPTITRIVNGTPVQSSFYILNDINHVIWDGVTTIHFPPAIRSPLNAVLGLSDGAEYVRPPFHTIETILLTDPEEPVDFVHYLPYAVGTLGGGPPGNGWTFLPGIGTP